MSKPNKLVESTSLFGDVPEVTVEEIPMIVVTKLDDLDNYCEANNVDSAKFNGAVVLKLDEGVDCKDIFKGYETFIDSLMTASDEENIHLFISGTSACRGILKDAPEGYFWFAAANKGPMLEYELFDESKGQNTVSHYFGNRLTVMGESYSVYKVYHHKK